ncbi:hypothetical protein V6N11_013056 [Hibiscus sabdariffa]|uniref:Uncharacterized protein n=1 Tax=Hibiscus sabdariffa TaxID=183260 RepID=A0ABR2NCL2_9ROSI
MRRSTNVESPTTRILAREPYVPPQVLVHSLRVGAQKHMVASFAVVFFRRHRYLISTTPYRRSLLQACFWVGYLLFVASKIIDHKLNDFSFLNWNHAIELYLLSLSIDIHLTDDPPTDDSQLPWMREDACLYIHINNSIDNTSSSTVTIFVDEYAKFLHLQEIVKQLSDLNSTLIESSKPIHVLFPPYRNGSLILALQIT